MSAFSTSKKLVISIFAAMIAVAMAAFVATPLPSKAFADNDLIEVTGEPFSPYIDGGYPTYSSLEALEIEARGGQYDSKAFNDDEDDILQTAEATRTDKARGIILNAVGSRTKEIDIDRSNKFSKELFETAFSQVKSLSCFYYVRSMSLSWSYHPDTPWDTTVTGATFYYDDAPSTNMINGIKNALKWVSTSMTPVQKVQAVHDYMALNCQYATSSIDGNPSNPIYSAYGCLVNGKAVCNGYAEAYKLLMGYLGIDCEIVYGRGNGGSHAWNAVKLNGNWYNVDVTWDDPTGMGSNYVRWNYFLVTNDEIGKDHTWTSNKMPCNTKYTNRSFSRCSNKNASYTLMDEVGAYNIANASYTGTARTTTFTLKKGSTTFTKDTHYTIAYYYNVEKGTAIASCRGKGTLLGIKAVRFKIVGPAITKPSLTQWKYTYTGREIRPTVKLYMDKKYLTQGRDFTVEYAHNVNAGTGYVTVRGINEYSGAQTIAFSIATLKTTPDVRMAYTGYGYTGKPINAKIGSVRVNGISLPSTQYTVKYMNNINVGKGTAVVTLKGNCSGAKSVTFNIVPPTTGFTQLTAGYKSITARWAKRTTQVDGYEFRLSSNRSMSGAKIAQLKGNTKCAAQITGISSNKQYFMQIRTYKYVGSTKYVSAWCNVASRVAL